MTKVRDPLTAQSALLKIATRLGFDGCADIVGKSTSEVRKYSDAETARHISFQNAIRLDIAYRNDGGLESPFLDVFAAKVREAGGEEPSKSDFLFIVSNALKEVSEATAIAAQLENDARIINRAKREIAEGIGALQSVLNILEHKKK